MRREIDASIMLWKDTYQKGVEYSRSA